MEKEELKKNFTLGNGKINSKEKEFIALEKDFRISNKRWKT